MPATINGTTGFGGNLIGNVTGNVTGTSSAVADGAVSAAKLDGAQTGSAPIYGCRAWVNFDGTAGTTVDGEFRCTIRASGNVSKVVRTATGTYTIYFTTAMPDANYAMVEYHASSGLVGTMHNPARAINSVSFVTSGWNNASTSNGANSNFSEVYALIFR